MGPAGRVGSWPRSRALGLPLPDLAVVELEAAFGRAEPDPEIQDILEDGDTFEANAVKKARIVARHTGRPALADDSGLEVDALDGTPGITSARFAGEGATDETNNARLLTLLDGIPEKKRTARFRCAIAIATPDGTVRTAEGCCEGRILHSPKGRWGFGYDPLFLLPEHGLTFSELPPEKKNRISHRGRALRAARSLISESLL